MNNFFRVFTLVVILALPVGFAVAQDCAPETCLDDEMRARIDAHMEQVMGDLSVPGGAIGVVQNGEIVYLQGYGSADDSGRSVTPQTPFVLASISKSFTALAIMQLVEAGKLDLDAPVQQVLPWFRTADRSASAQITVRDLLHQTSGFTNYTGNDFSDDTSQAAVENAVRRLSEVELSGDETFEYSNTNYDILGLLVEAVSGESYADYLQTYIFDPLDMQHSYTTDRLPDAQADGLTTGYGSFFGAPVAREIIYPNAHLGSVGVISTAEDLSHYMLAQLNGGVYGDNRVLSEAGMAALQEPGVEAGDFLSYAMGWFRNGLWRAGTPAGDTVNVPLSLEHNGVWLGFSTNMIMLPSENLGVVTLLNHDDFTRQSAFNHAAYGATLLMAGVEPPEMEVFEDSITQNALLIYLVVIGLLLLRLVSAALSLRQWRRHPGARPAHPLGIAVKILLPLAVDVLAAYLILVVIPDEYNSPFLETLRFNPDLGGLMILSLILMLGWGAVRTVLFARVLLRRPTEVVAARAYAPASS